MDEYSVAFDCDELRFCAVIKKNGKVSRHMYDDEAELLLDVLNGDAKYKSVSYKCFTKRNKLYGV